MNILKNIFGKNDTKIHVDEISASDKRLLGDSIIVEAGNGYVKFGDGTMLAFANRAMSTSADTALGSMYRNTPEQWIFPKPFVGIPHTFAHVIRGMWYGMVVMGTDDSNAHQVNFAVLSPISYPEDKPVVSLFAIGRWK